MRTTVANMIYIEEPTDAVKRWAKENLEFPNPEYEKKQRMGFWLGRTPKTLRLYEWRGKTLVVPFGVLKDIWQMVNKERFDVEFHADKTVPYGDPVPLYDYQRVAVNEMIKAKFGILKSTTGSGKTQMGIALIKTLCKRALWLCHTADLLKQSRDRALQYMDPSLIGTITEGKVNIGEGVTFATVQTMANLELQQYRDEWDVVIVDECHRVSSSASTFTRYEKVLNHLAARRKYGLTATPERSDGLIKATFALLGGVAYEVPEDAVADKVMNVKVRPVETDIELDERCLNPDGTINYVKMIEHLTTDKDRNDLIAEKIIENRGHSCLILSDRLEQLKTILFRLPDDMVKEAAYIDGKMQSKKAKAEREQAIEDMRTGEKKYLFASYNLAKEGLDVPRLDRLFLASPAKFSSIITQAVGRVRRTFEGKETPVVYDFVDKEIGFCARAYKERCRSYRKMNAEIEKGFLT